MKFARPKQVVYCNNKGGVGKTTLAFNTAVSFAEKGFKTVLVDLDPQCNLSLLALGAEFYEGTLFSDPGRKDIYHILEKKITGAGDVDLAVPLKALQTNLFILPGSLSLSLFENLLLNSFNEAAAGGLRGYSDTSAIDRYLRHIGQERQIDIFVIDTSPSLGILNRVIFLGADYFVVPMMADSFSVQGIENLGVVFEQWKKQWKNTALAVAGVTPKSHVLNGDCLFIGYIINHHIVYAQKVVKRQREWLERIPQKVKGFLSERHCRNGLVEKSWRDPLGIMQDYGQLAAISMENNRAIHTFEPSVVKELTIEGTKQVFEKAKDEFEILSNNILAVLSEN